MAGVIGSPHTPVLVSEVINSLAPKRGGRYIDGTVGAGGHAARILESAGEDASLLGLDVDLDALELARKRLAEFDGRAILVNANFRDLETVARGLGFVPADGVLLDLGLSSMQLSNPTRGFSFAGDNLDMRMNPAGGLKAQDLVNDLSEKDLADVIYKFGEEKQSRRIARRIVESRPIHSAQDLAEVIQRAVGRRGRVHPATKTFQALRIAVNHELENLEKVLPALSGVTTIGSRVAIITFHSLEDRLVKNYFKKNLDWLNLTKHPIKPSRTEILANPRSRSAKLRVAQRL